MCIYGPVVMITVYMNFGITAHTWDWLGSLREGQQYHGHVSDLHLHYHNV